MSQGPPVFGDDGERFGHNVIRVPCYSTTADNDRGLRASRPVSRGSPVTAVSLGANSES
jgi:hypothetical protein